MRHVVLHVMVAVMAVFFSHASYAQVTFTIANSTACTNMVDVPVRVSDFTNVSAFSFTIEWPTSSLTYVSYTSSGNLAGLDQGSSAFGVNQTGSGKLTVFWTDPSLNGRTLSANTVLFTMRFNATGTIGSTSTVSFTDSPLQRLVATGFPPNQVAFISQNGTISVGDTQAPVLTCGAAVSAAVTSGSTTANVTVSAPSVTDNCTTNPSITWTAMGASPASGSGSATANFPIGTTTVTFSATDAAGNVGTCTRQVTVTGATNTASMLLSAGDVTLACGQTMVTVPISVTDFTNISALSSTINWNTGHLTFVEVVNPGILSDLGPSSFGTTNTNNGEMTLFWNDNTPPFGVTLAPNTTIFSIKFNLVPGGPSSSNVTFGDNPVQTLAGAGFPPSSVTVVRDPGTINGTTDTTPPVITNCPVGINTTVNQGTCSATNIMLGVPTATDNCGTPTLTNNAPSPFPTGTTIVTWTATDASGNTATCTQTIVVTEAIPPVVTCGSSFSVSPDPGGCTASNVTLPVATATDNCTNNPAITHNAPAVYPSGNTVVVFTATDNSGNTGTCSLTVTVLDNIPPTITCVPSNTQTVSTDAGECSATGVAISVPTATDNCGTVTVTSNAPSVYALGVNIITFTATDAAGNTATCTSTVTVEDDELPTLDACTPITLSTGTSDCFVAPNEIQNLGFADNCVGASISNNVSAPLQVGVHNVIWVAMDAAGNTASCTQEITVVDDAAPVLTCPNDITTMVALDECTVSFSSFQLATAVDNCDMNLTVTHNFMQPAAPGVYVVTHSASDDEGNLGQCFQTITVVDDQDPIITCPPTVNAVAGAGICEATSIVLGTATAVDNCAIDMIFDDAPSTFPVGNTTVTYTATDVNGNAAVCTQTVNVADLEFPTLVCPADVDIFLAAGVSSQVVNGIDPTFGDNCTPTLTYTLSGATTATGSGSASGLTFQSGVTLVTYTVTDGQNNQVDCGFEVRLVFNSGLAIFCPNDTTVSTLAGNCSRSVATGLTPIVTDPSQIESVTWVVTGATTASSPATGVNSANGQTFQLGVSTLTYTLTDTTGVEYICSSTVTVTDMTAPVFTGCPSNQLIQVGSNQCTATATWTAPTATDNCSATVTVTSTHSSGATFAVGDQIVRYTATDAAGNSSTCTFIIAVRDTIAPMISNCPGNINISTTGINCSGVTTWTEPTATDNCTTVIVTSSHAPGDTFLAGTTTVTYTFTDTSDNVSVCQFTVTVADNNAPTFTSCPGDITLSAASGVCYAIADWALPTATDTCGFVTLTSNISIGDTLLQGQYLVEYTATDATGNEASCSFEVVVEDNEAPVFLAFANDTITINNDLGQCGTTINVPTATATDNCGTVTVTANISNGDFLPVGMQAIVYTATDGAGNSATKTLHVNVVDNEIPVYSGVPNDTLIFTQAGQCSATLAYNISATDNCGITSLTVNPPSGSTFSVGVTSVTAVALDDNGNALLTNFNVTVVDGQAPVFACPASVQVNTNGTIISDPSGFLQGLSLGSCGQVALTFAAPIATDDCSTPVVTQVSGPTSGSMIGVGSYLLVFRAVDASGVSTNCTVSVDVSALPSPIASASASSICANSVVTLSVTAVSNATYTWTDTQGNAYGNTRTLALSNLAAGIYNFRCTVRTSNGCVLTAGVSVAVNGLPSPVIGHNNVLCPAPGTNLFLMGADANNTSVLMWQWAGPNGFTSNQQSPVIQNVTTAASGAYTLTITTNAGCTASTTQTINVNTNSTFSTPTIQLSDSEICLGESTFLIGQQYPGVQVQYHVWAAPTAGNGLPPSVSNFTAITPSLAGNYTYFYAATVDGCRTDTVQATLTVDTYPQVTISIQGNTTCVDGTTNIELRDVTGNAASYEWRNPMGQVIGNSNPLMLNNVGASASGTYVLYARSATGCQTIQPAVVSISQKPLTPSILSSTDTVLCLGGSFYLSASDDYPSPVNYLWTGSGIVGNANQAVVQFMPTSAGVYSYNVVVESQGCTSNMSAPFEVTVESKPVISIDFDNSTAGCVDGTTNAQFIGSSNAVGNYSWTNDNGTILGTDLTLTLNNVTSANSGTYTLTVESLQGTCRSSAPINVNFLDKPLTGPNVTVLGNLCIDESVQLMASSIPGATYRWFSDSTGFSSTAQNPIIPVLVSAFNDNYFVVATVNGCASPPSAPVGIVTVPEPNPAGDSYAVEIGIALDDMDVIANDNLLSGPNFTVEVVKDTEFGTLEQMTKGVFRYTPTTTTRKMDNFIYEVCYEDCQLCDRAVVNLQVEYAKDDCVVSTVFSPNNDGMNETLIVSCLKDNVLPGNSFQVFNQWGDEVFNAAPYNNTWDGTYKGEKLPDGTYFYIFQKDRNTEPQKGFITIFR